ncbi:MAG: hypothetical protein NTU62_07780, partial [Spirochaetes bacterium]|nr:hypothetical protein [Spirochaetota bacterium]
APNASLTVSGELLRLGGTTKRTAAKEHASPGEQRTGPGKGFRDPFAAGDAQPAPGASAAAVRLDLRRPSTRPDANLAAAPAGPSLAVTYQVAPRATLENTFDADGWDAPSDIDLGILYGTFVTAGTGRVQAAGSLIGQRLDLSMSLGFDSLWRLRFNPAPKLLLPPFPTAWDTLVKSDVQQDRLDFTSVLGATLRPFGAISPFAGSTVTWLLGMRLVQMRWDGVSDPLSPLFKTTTVDLTKKDMVSAHSLQATVPFRASGANGTFMLASVLPPLDGTLTTRLDASAWILKGRVQAGGTQSAGTWQAQPLLIGLSAEPWKGVSLSEELQASLEGDGLQRSTTQLRAGGFSASFVAERLLPVDILTGAKIGTEYFFLPSTVKLAYEGTTGPLWSWKDRVRIEAGLRTGWSMNVQRYTDNLFEFAPRLTLAVSEFLDLTFSSLSVNNKTYLYIPGLGVPFGESWVNPITDLGWSFNFFNPADRYRSAFKIRSISMKAVHHLHDWDLSFEYAGAPKLITSGTKRYEWSPTFSINLQWIPVPEVKAAVRGDRNEAGEDRIHVRE